VSATLASPPPRRRPAPDSAAPTGGYLVFAAHGGAGASTVAALLTAATGPGLVLEGAAARPAQLAAAPRELLLVARATAYGLARAAAALSGWSLPAPYLVLVADAPLGDPPAVRFRAAALRARTAGLARLDYLPAARGVDDPRQLAGTAAAERAARRLLAQLTSPAASQGAFR